MLVDRLSKSGIFINLKNKNEAFSVSCLFEIIFNEFNTNFQNAFKKVYEFFRNDAEIGIFNRIGCSGKILNDLAELEIVLLDCKSKTLIGTN